MEEKCLATVRYDAQRPPTRCVAICRDEKGHDGPHHDDVVNMVWDFDG